MKYVNNNSINDLIKFRFNFQFNWDILFVTDNLQFVSVATKWWFTTFQCWLSSIYGGWCRNTLNCDFDNLFYPKIEAENHKCSWLTFSFSDQCLALQLVHSVIRAWFDWLDSTVDFLVWIAFYIQLHTVMLLLCLSLCHDLLPLWKLAVMMLLFLP